MELAAVTRAAVAGEIVADDEAAMLEEFLCPLCLTHAFESAVTTPCEHIFHRQCIEGALRGPHPRSCPTCRRGLPPGQGAFTAAPHCVRRALARTPVRCPQGCGAAMPFELLRGHVLRDCPDTPFRCAAAGCGVLLRRSELPGHPCPHPACEQGAAPLQPADAPGAAGQLVALREQVGRQLRIIARQHEHISQQRRRIGEQEDQLARHGREALAQRDQLARLRKQVAALQAAGKGDPRAVSVRSVEVPALAGRYELLPQQVNGAPVWGRGEARLYVARGGRQWRLARSEALMAQDKGALCGHLKPAPGGAPAVAQWYLADGHGWWGAAPGTSVELV